MAQSKVRYAVVGLGYIAQAAVLPSFAHARRNSSLHAIVSGSTEKLNELGDKYRIPVRASYDEYERCLQEVDAVYIATPNSQHADYAVRAAKAGKHVLCEKPFAIDAKQAVEMRDAAERSGRTAMVGHEFRHTPQRAYIKELLDEGYIGRFQLCTIELFLDRYVTREPRPLTWMASESEGGGLLGALGSHYIDGLRHWFGEVASVTGRLAILRPDLIDLQTNAIVKAETDDTFLFTLEFANGGIATMSASFATTPARGAKIVVMGESGTLIAEQPGPNPMENGVVVASRDGAALQPLATPAKYTPFTDDRDHRLMAFRLLVREFTQGIEQRISPSPNFTDGLRCQEVLDAVRASSKSGRTVKLR